MQPDTREADFPMRNGIFMAPFHPLDRDPTEAIQRDLGYLGNCPAVNDAVC